MMINSDLAPLFFGCGSAARLRVFFKYCYLKSDFHPVIMSIFKLALHDALSQREVLGPHADDLEDLTIEDVLDRGFKISQENNLSDLKGNEHLVSHT